MFALWYTEHMKQIFNVIFYTLVGAGAGLAIGAYLGHLDQLLIIIPAIVAGVALIAAITTTTLIVKAERAAKNASVTLQKHDIVLQTGTVYTVGKHGKVRPGEYKVLSANENDKTFNLRVNDYVKEYHHNTTLVLAEGDTISARSGNVILR